MWQGRAGDGVFETTEDLELVVQKVGPFVRFLILRHERDSRSPMLLESGTEQDFGSAVEAARRGAARLRAAGLSRGRAARMARV